MTLNDCITHHFTLYTVSRKKVPLIFCCNLYKYWRIFIIIRAQLRKRMPKSLAYITTHSVMLLPYRVKVSDTKVTHFTPILALCTCLYRSHLRKPVLMKQTKHNRKSEAQNLCSKCPPFTRTHAFKRLRHCTIADGFGDSVQYWCYTAALLGIMG